MHAMNGHPARRRIFKAAHRNACKRVFQPQWTLEAAMAEQPVITKIDPQSAKGKNSEPGERQASPAEEPGAKGQKRQQMAASDRCRIAPIDPPLRYADRKRQDIRSLSHKKPLGALRIWQQAIVLRDSHHTGLSERLMNCDVKALFARRISHPPNGLKVVRRSQRHAAGIDQ